MKHFEKKTRQILATPGYIIWL